MTQRTLYELGVLQFVDEAELAALARRFEHLFDVELDGICKSPWRVADLRLDAHVELARRERERQTERAAWETP